MYSCKGDEPEQRSSGRKSKGIEKIRIGQISWLQIVDSLTYLIINVLN
jgi:hypothetical protein